MLVWDSKKEKYMHVAPKLQDSWIGTWASGGWRENGNGGRLGKKGKEGQRNTFWHLALKDRWTWMEAWLRTSISSIFLGKPNVGQEATAPMAICHSSPPQCHWFTVITHRCHASFVEDTLMVTPRIETASVSPRMSHATDHFNLWVRVGLEGSWVRVRGYQPRLTCNHHLKLLFTLQVYFFQQYVRKCQVDAQ